MRNIATKLIQAVTGLALATSITVSAAADILIIDQERVQREAAAFKDFDLQTAKIRDAIIALRQRTSPDGFWDQTAVQFQQRMVAELDDLEKENPSLVMMPMKRSVKPKKRLSKLKVSKCASSCRMKPTSCVSSNCISTIYAARPKHKWNARAAHCCGKS